MDPYTAERRDVLGNTSPQDCMISLGQSRRPRGSKSLPEEGAVFPNAMHPNSRQCSAILSAYNREVFIAFLRNWGPKDKNLSKLWTSQTWYFLPFLWNIKETQNMNARIWPCSCLICSWCTRLEHKPRNYLLSSRPFCMGIRCNKSFIRERPMLVFCGQFWI